MCMVLLSLFGIIFCHYIYIYIYISVGTSDSVMYIAMLIQCSSEWPRGLRREAATALFLGLRVRIPPGPWMYLSLVIVVPCQVDVSAKYTSLVRRSPTECGVSEFVLKPRQWGGLGPRSLSSQEKKMACSIILWFLGSELILFVNHVQTDSGIDRMYNAVTATGRVAKTLFWQRNSSYYQS